MYPNPANEYLKIDLPEQGIYAIKVFNSHGKLVKSLTLDGNNKLDIHELSNGVYTIQIKDARNKLTSNQFIKQ